MSERANNPEEIRALRCDEWEDMLVDALDGTLSPADAAAFHRHHGDCALCAQMLKENQQGRAWMEYLAAEPDVPAGLLNKILARTTGPQALGVPQAIAAAPVGPTWHGVSLTRMRHAGWQLPRQLSRHLLEPRLMMTVAMAFFSIALTLNLTGINLSQVRAADLQPARLRATMTRQYYSTNQQVTKYYENLRVVYEMEARVRELRRSTEPASSQQSPQSSPKPTPRQPVRDGSGTPSSRAPRGGVIPVPEGNRSLGKSEVASPALLVRAWPQRLAQSDDLAVTPAGFDPVRKAIVKREVLHAVRYCAHGWTERSLL